MFLLALGCFCVLNNSVVTLRTMFKDLDPKTMRTMVFLDDLRLGQMWQQGNLLLQERGIVLHILCEVNHGTCNDDTHCPKHPH